MADMRKRKISSHVLPLSLSLPSCNSSIFLVLRERRREEVIFLMHVAKKRKKIFIFDNEYLHVFNDKKKIYVHFDSKIAYFKKRKKRRRKNILYV